MPSHDIITDIATLLTALALVSAEVRKWKRKDEE